MDVDHVGKMLGIDNIPIPQPELAPVYPQCHKFLRLRYAGKQLVRQRIDVLLGEGLDQIVQRPDLKSLQRMIGGGRGKNQQTIRIGFAQLFCRLHARHAIHINIQKCGSKGRFPCRFQKCLAAFVFQNIRLHVSPLKLLLQPVFQQCTFRGKIVHNRNSHAANSPSSSCTYSNPK